MNPLAPPLSTPACVLIDMTGIPGLPWGQAWSRRCTAGGVRRLPSLEIGGQVMRLEGHLATERLL